jgi:hypothetical protein
MPSKTANMKKVFGRAGVCLLAGAVLTMSLPTAGDTKPVVIRGIPSTAASNQLQLAYQASFPNGSLDPSLDKLNAGAMQPGDTGIANSNPTFSPLPGEFLVGITRPADLSPNLTPAASIWATPVNFGPGSVSRLRATYIAPVGPLQGGGFAFGLVAKIGGKDDLGDEESKIAVTVNVRPGFLVRFGAAFGNVEPARVVLPDAVKDAMFSTTDPQPFTIDLTIDRTHVPATATAKLTVIDQVFTVTFTLADFLADSGPTITAVGPGIAVNPFGPGQTASVHVRDFRIYANAGG